MEVNSSRSGRFTPVHIQQDRRVPQPVWTCLDQTVSCDRDLKCGPSSRQPIRYANWATAIRSFETSANIHRHGVTSRNISVFSMNQLYFLGKNKWPFKKCLCYWANRFYIYLNCSHLSTQFHQAKPFNDFFLFPHVAASYVSVTSQCSRTATQLHVGHVTRPEWLAWAGTVTP